MKRPGFSAVIRGDAPVVPAEISIEKIPLVRVPSLNLSIEAKTVISSKKGEWKEEGQWLYFTTPSGKMFAIPKHRIIVVYSFNEREALWVSEDRR